MNKTALKNFATNARNELMKKVEAKAFKIGITEENIKKAQLETSDVIYIDGKQLSITEKKQRDKLIQRIKDIGFNRVIEEVAYTWFNRFIALRFMEVNNYLPTKVRVLSSSNPDSPEPDIIKEALSVDLDIDKELVYELKVNNKTEELFKYLIIKQCNSLNKYLPFMFETIDDYKEILFPEGLLAKDSFLREMTDNEKILESDWRKIEIIGWLYQYYISEEKDRVFKEKKKFSSEEIPYATQLFTPDWIVRYMVQNSLGRYWVESHPEYRDLISNWELYIQKSNQETDFEEKMAPFINKELKVEAIKCFDPAMGSGHILVYMFDVLYEIYSRCGYMDREIPKLIIENNLYGLDIDDRAYQLACFSIVMKALEYNGRFLRNIEREGLILNLAAIQETNILTDQDIAYLAGEKIGSCFNITKKFVEQFRDAKTIGSLLKIDINGIKFLSERLNDIKNTQINDLFDVEKREKILSLLPQLLIQANIMTEQYDILVTNPPYMGSTNMNAVLSDYLKKHYPDSKADLFAAFMEIEHYFKKNSIYASINQHSWMFLSSFEKLREKIIQNRLIENMLHLGPRAFEEIAGEVVQSTAFILRNFFSSEMKGIYLRLVDERTAKEKKEKAILAVKNSQAPYRYSFYQTNCSKIPGFPIAYWISEKVREAFKKGITLSQVSEPKQGLSTADNNRFLRFWFEVDYSKIGFKISDPKTAADSNYKWFPFNKGGEFRKWYGNNEYVINWEKNGQELKSYPKSVIRNPDYYFKEGITWTLISTSSFGCRYSEKGFIFDAAGSTLFSDNNLFYILGFMSSKLSHEFLKILNPTLNFSNGVISKLPLIENSERKQEVENIVCENIEISREEWDDYETSWNFSRHPFVKEQFKDSNLEMTYNNWAKYSEFRFNRLKLNEEKLNSIFVEIYGLQEVLNADVNERDVTLRTADLEKDIRSFISYATGCVFGRFSLDKDGLVNAGATIESKINQAFRVDEDNILPVISDAYFDDDVISRFIDFVKVTFGEETLNENLEFIAQALGKRDGETAKEVIRKYFLNDFYKDHLQIYKKRPIYWLFTSGKQKAFNCLIYMHRYDKSTLSRIRTDYLHELQIRLDAEKKSLLSIIEGDGTAKEISNAKKELKALDLKIDELKAYDELLHHMADRQIEIDLDEGVAVNYAKFEGLVAKIQ